MYKYNNPNNTEIFINKVSKIHNYKYIYTKTKYVDSRTKLTITCPKHGDFTQRPDCHLSGARCIKCVNEDKTLSNSNFKNELIRLYGDRYGLWKVNYTGYRCKITIYCDRHGYVETSPNLLLSGGGCTDCNSEFTISKQCKPLSKVIEDFEKRHDYRYDYRLVREDYKNCYTKVKIICETHGIFEQQPREHIKGRGCSKCKNSKGENDIIKYLKHNNITYEIQKRIDGCHDKKPLRFDFYLVEYDTYLEYDGEQHYRPIELFGGEEAFNDRQRKDKIKNDFCENNNLKLYRIKYNENVEERMEYIISELKTKK